MKTIGLLGGMSWESTERYYRLINETVREKRGGLHSARILLHSLDFAPVEALQRRGDWDALAAILTDTALQLERAGAEALVICSNTPHKLAPQITAALHIPLLHIAEATAIQLGRECLDSAALLGTRYTMTQDFYKDKLRSAGICVLTPEGEDADTVDSVIFDELCRGQLREESRQRLRKIIDRLAARGAQSVILACTELGLLIRPEDVSIPTFDTTQIHARYAALWSLQK